MKSGTRNIEEILKRSWSSASQEQVETASRRVLRHLRSQANVAAEESDASSVRVSLPASRRVAVAYVATAILFGAFVVWAAVVRQSPTPAAKAAEELLNREPEPLALPVQPSSPSVEPIRNPAPPHPQFAVASIKVYPPGTVYPDLRAGVACHGIDGVQRMVFTLRQNMDPVVVAPQGRCVAVGILLPNLIRFAWGITDVTGGPDWANRPGSVLNTPEGVVYGSRSVFQIEAAADDPATPTAEQLKQMLQTMLADRFKLKFHKEMRESPGYALVVAESGPKLKATSDRPESPVRLFNEKGREIIKGKSTLAPLIQILYIGGPIVDKTGVAGVYEYELVMPDFVGGGQRGAPGEAQPAVPAPDRAGAWSAALEAQLGLRLQAEKAVPTQRLVIDHVELPSPN